MRRLSGAFLLLVGIIVVPNLTDAQAPAPGNNTTPQTPVDSAKLQPGEFFGTLKTTPDGERTFVLKIDLKTLAPNGKAPPKANPAVAKGNQALQKLLNLQNQLVQAMTSVQSAKTPQQRSQAMSKIQNLQNQIQQATTQANAGALAAQAGAIGPDGAPVGYKWVITSKDVEFQTTEEVKVRLMKLPEEFDEKGNIKKYTKAELTELKGKDKNLPGYESSVEKLEVGMKVQVTLATHKKRKPTSLASTDKEKEKDADKEAKEKDADKEAKEKDADKEAKDKAKEAPKAKDKDADAPVETEKKLQVKLILILSEGTGAGSSPGETKKKKKDNN